MGAQQEPRRRLRVLLIAESCNPDWASVPLRCAAAILVGSRHAWAELLEAAAPLARAGRLQVDLVGDGPERGRLESLAARERFGSAVRFLGWVEHRQLSAVLSGCQLFGFPSIRDFGGAAVLEAMEAAQVLEVYRFAVGQRSRPDFGMPLPETAEADSAEPIVCTTSTDVRR